MHLVATAGKWRQELNERIVTEDAFDAERLAVAINPQGDDLKLAVRGLESGGFRTVLEAAGRIEGDLIGGRRNGAFGQRMMRGLPQVVIGAVTVPATFRTSIGGEVIGCRSGMDMKHDQEECRQKKHPFAMSPLSQFVEHAP